MINMEDRQRRSNLRFFLRYKNHFITWNLNNEWIVLNISQRKYIIFDAIMLKMTIVIKRVKTMQITCALG